MVRALAVLALLCFSASALAAELAPIPPRPITGVEPPTAEEMSKWLSPEERQKQEEKEVADCKAKGWEWSPADFGSNFIWTCKTKEEAAKIKAAREAHNAECKKKGGKWGTFDLYATFECLVPYKDANKPCQKNADCTEKCVKDPKINDHGICTEYPERGCIPALPFKENDVPNKIAEVK